MHEPTEKDNEEIAVREARRSLFAFFSLFTRCMSLLTTSLFSGIWIPKVGIYRRIINFLAS